MCRFRPTGCVHGTTRALRCTGLCWCCGRARAARQLAYFGRVWVVSKHLVLFVGAHTASQSLYIRRLLILVSASSRNRHIATSITCDLHLPLIMQTIRGTSLRRHVTMPARTRLVVHGFVLPCCLQARNLPSVIEIAPSAFGSTASIIASFDGPGTVCSRVSRSRV
jgi:hypothetical protein